MCTFQRQELALEAVRMVTVDLGGGAKEIDIKNYAKVEKIPGGTIEDCRVLKGRTGNWGLNRGCAGVPASIGVCVVLMHRSLATVPPAIMRR